MAASTSTSDQNLDISKVKIEKITVSVLSKSKTKHSYCWNFFGNLNVEINGKKRTVLSDQVFCEACLKTAKAKDCSLVFPEANVKAYSKNIATGNLFRHLKDDHKIEEPQQKAKIVPIETFFSVERRSAKKTDDSSRNDKSQLARDLALWFARSLMPFDSVDDEAMQDFFKKYKIIVSDSDLPSRHNIAREGLEDVYESMLKYVKSIIEKQGSGYGALTADLWTDQYRRRNYITCTYHFITEEMELKKVTLATKQVIGKHTGETIQDEINEITQDFQIQKSKVVLVTDAGSNMKRAANLLNMENHLCLGHALHNLVKVDGIQATEEVKNLIIKCKKVVKHLRYRASQQAEHRELLMSIDEIGEQFESTDETSDSSERNDSPERQHIDAISVPPSIKTSTPTCWHSMLMMLSSLNHRANRHPINDMLRDIGRNTYQLKDYEHRLIADLITLLEKIKQIVEILCSESQPTINLALVFKSELKRLLEEVSDAEPVPVTMLKNKMLFKLDHRFPSNDIVVTASLLDCRFRAIKEVGQFMETQNTTKVAFLTNMTQKYIRNTEMSTEQRSTFSTSTTHAGPSSASSLSANLARRHSSQPDNESIIENECWKYFSVATAADLEAYNLLSSLREARRSRLNPLRINRIIFIHDNYHHCKNSDS